MTNYYTQRELVKETINETWDENGKLISRETIREYAPVQQNGWWQNPVVSWSTDWAEQPVDLLAGRVII